jgi:teichuronic acid biosynthesis glycosyltransferase TuaC
LNILVLSSLYPSAARPRHGIFVEHRVAHLARPGDAVRVVVPVPWFPSGAERWGRWGEHGRVPRFEERRGVPVLYPRVPVLPRVGMTAAPWLMAAALRRPLARLRREFQFDVIDAHYLYPDGVAAAMLARVFGVPLVLTALGSDVSLIPDWRWPRAMILRAVGQAHATTVVAEALRARLVALGAPAEKVVTLFQGVDLQLFRPLEDRAAERARLGWDGPTLLSVGHLIARKGHDIAIRAVAAMPGVRLAIVGDGPEEARLRALGGPVEFLGHVDQPRLARLFAAADVTVNCADREGMANVLIESVACGTPVVATPVWGSPELVRVPEAGRLAADRSPEAVRGALAALLADPPERAATRAYGERFDWRETGRAHRRLLADAVAAERL